MLRLAFDQNNDGNFGQNCGQADPNEASFGLSWFVCGNPYSLIITAYCLLPLWEKSL
jgi:hypothetical protein